MRAEDRREGFDTVGSKRNGLLRKNVSKSSSSLFSSTASECDSPSSVGSPHTIFGPGDNPQTVKTRLRQWAQVVACSVRQSSSNINQKTEFENETQIDSKKKTHITYGF
ncbi:hypothetical protein LOK49_LG02G01385 [Camellia lanceoleosa]|uniref:Uncharacterized protein n=1 Tax=Camellia lanceoleosa TaxID=1840588 RepID=A0ACC0IR39_9ERIC|nr:hypothetical protein LOK49_LG02G01385 [Camellia lanceoleosa]